MLPDDPLCRILRVDLSRRTFSVERRPELFDELLGGTGVGVRLLAEGCPAGVDPLAPEAVVVLAVGPLTSHLPLMSKAVALFKSPLTGNLGESHCGGRTAVALRLAGLGAVVITGRSERPLYLAIHGDEVGFRDASALWGARGTGTVGRVIREREPGAGLRSIMRIGRAGERGVRYASVTSETYRHFGRLGLGAVLGSKGLKAITISGKRALPLADFSAYRKLYKETYDMAVETSMMKKYHDLGTAGNVASLDRLSALPAKNLTVRRLDGVAQITGEAFAEGYLGRRLACAHCPVGCVHIAALRQPYAQEAYFYKTSLISYDYELIYALGAMLGVTDPEGALRLMDEVEVLGLDAMSAGVVLAWATEAQQRGLVGTAETDGLALAWGDWQVYLAALDRIVEQPTPFFEALALGVDQAAAQYGGSEFALAFGGNEMPGYHTGPAAHVGFLVGARHSHLCNAGYSLDQKALSEGRTLEPAGLATKLIQEESWRQVLSSLVSCFFARGIYTPELVSRGLACVGCAGDPAKLEQIGEAIYREKYRYKLREGFTFEGLRLPARIFETPSGAGPIDPELVRQTIACVAAFHQEPRAGNG
ncbi:MAG: aldehyde ferredoxin oxidoreductase N-terminal domain-containing protein [Myxococcota bacterium]|jgi:aldehyde:ferredoxin oxidoreductase|nr:aldehyde ferredoxin oxidoreductase N-terminal domain-containing protein [Myxococcota bacterium]